VRGAGLSGTALPRGAVVLDQQEIGIYEAAYVDPHEGVMLESEHRECVGADAAGRRWVPEDITGAVRSPTTRTRRLAYLIALVGAAAAAAVGLIEGSSVTTSGVLLQRGDRDEAGDWRISSRYRTLWKPGENSTQLCKQNPWPQRLPGRCVHGVNACGR